MSKEIDKAEYRIYDAEREYLNATDLHPFDLHVSRASKAPVGILAGYALAGYEMIFER